MIPWHPQDHRQCCAVGCAMSRPASHRQIGRCIWKLNIQKKLAYLWNIIPCCPSYLLSWFSQKLNNLTKTTIIFKRVADASPSPHLVVHLMTFAAVPNERQKHSSYWIVSLVLVARLRLRCFLIFQSTAPSSQRTSVNHAHTHTHTHTHLFRRAAESRPVVKQSKYKYLNTSYGILCATDVNGDVMVICTVFDLYCDAAISSACVLCCSNCNMTVRVRVFVEDDVTCLLEGSVYISHVKNYHSK